MPLDISSDVPPTDTDPFSTPSSFGDGSDSPYPHHIPLAPFSRFLGYTESDRARYINAQLTITSKLLSLDLTPAERAALAYYDGLFYTYESYGDIMGTTAGLTLGYALRNRKPGPVANGLARMVGQGHNPRAVKIASTGLKLLAFGIAGRMYGITTAGVQALNRMRAEQRKDPIMARVVKARDAKIGEIKAAVATGRRAGGRREVGAAAGEQEDEQSLGGMETADLERRSGEDMVREENKAFPFGRPSEKIAELQQESPKVNGDDIFGLNGDEKEVEHVPQKGWRSPQSNTTESTWERLRRGQGAAPRAEASAPVEEVAPQRTSPWPARAPMKGFAGREEEPKTDSFSFSNSVEERELAKVQAQKEFDESVERERRSGGGDGYTEGDKGGRGWRG